MSDPFLSKKHNSCLKPKTILCSQSFVSWVSQQIFSHLFLTFFLLLFYFRVINRVWVKAVRKKIFFSNAVCLLRNFFFLKQIRCELFWPFFSNIFQHDWKKINNKKNESCNVLKKRKNFKNCDYNRRGDLKKTCVLS